MTCLTEIGCRRMTSYCASDGTRTRTDLAVQGIFVPLWLSPPGPLTVPVRGLDYSFTIGQYPVGVSCLVSAPSSNQRLGSRLPSASTVKASLNLRHSTSSLSGCALNLALPRRARISPSCLPFHHQGLPGVRRADA